MPVIAGIAAAVILLGVGGYFGYKKFIAKPDDAAQQTTETGQPAADPNAPSAASSGDTSSAPSTAQTPSGTQSPVYSTPAAQPPSSTATGRQPSSTPSSSSTPPSWTQPSTPSSPPAQTPSAPAQQPAQTATAPAQPPPPPVSTQPAQERPQILKPERTYPPAPTTPATPRYTGPSSGLVMWSGKLDRNAVVTIEGSSASSGTVTGSLPGVPVILETDLTNVGFAEMPGPSNGWKKFGLRSKKSQNIVISIRWKVLD